MRDRLSQFQMGKDVIIYSDRVKAIAISLLNVSCSLPSMGGHPARAEKQASAVTASQYPPMAIRKQSIP